MLFWCYFGVILVLFWCYFGVILVLLKENNEIEVLRKRVNQLEDEKKIFEDQNGPYKHSISGKNVKRDFDQKIEECENPAKGIVELKDRNARIFVELREQTKQSPKFECEVDYLKRKFGESE